MGAILIPSPPPPPTPPPATAPAVAQLEYDGTLPRITRIWLGNLLLFFLTLSFYRFWGRTRMRQYVWSHLSVFGDRLEYTGTGRELCFGFLLTLPLFIGLGFLSEQLSSALAFVPILFVGYFAVYSGLRYRVTRTTWRAIGCRFPYQNANDYSLLCFKRSFINLISFGFAVPKSDLLKWKFLVEQFSVGSLKGTFSLDTKGLMLPHLVSSVAMFLIAVVAIAIGIGAAKDIMQPNTLGKDGIKGFVAVIVVLLAGAALLLAFMIRQWYTARLVRKKFSGIRIGEMSVSYHCSTVRFIRFKLANLLILMLTLGLGGAFILHRKARFFSRHLRFHGQPDAASIRQMQAENHRLTEGLMDMFGIDFGLLS